jgi:hypothetical protein
MDSIKNADDFVTKSKVMELNDESLRIKKEINMTLF